MNCRRVYFMKLLTRDATGSNGCGGTIKSSLTRLAIAPNAR